MFVNNPLILEYSYRENMLHGILKNPEQKYLGSICKVTLLYGVKVLDPSGEDNFVPVYTQDIVLSGLENTFSFLLLQKYIEYSGKSIQVKYILKTDIINAVGLFDAEKTTDIFLQKEFMDYIASDVGVNTEDASIKTDAINTKQMLIGAPPIVKFLLFLGFFLITISLLGFTTLIPTFILPGFVQQISIQLLIFSVAFTGITFMQARKNQTFFLQAKMKKPYIILGQQNTVNIHECLEGVFKIPVDSLSIMFIWRIVERGFYWRGSGKERKLIPFQEVIYEKILQTFEVSHIQASQNINDVMSMKAFQLPVGEVKSPVISSLCNDKSLPHEMDQLIKTSNSVGVIKNIYGVESLVEVVFIHPTLPDARFPLTILQK
ncbi:MAG: hypothetical protein PHU93_04885 [Candidatus Gracilibacteria bacterium]|nr:hypothetical protein [Candidatus Gracilibacteria bacterium]